jgi:hypothetical protein
MTQTQDYSIDELTDAVKADRDAMRAGLAGAAGYATVPMDWQDRLAVYERQNRSHRLTPRQRRRTLHKLRHELGGVALVPIAGGWTWVDVEAA